MPAFSLYITDDRLARVRDEAARLGVSVAKVVTLAIDAHLAIHSPAIACVGKEGVSWTSPMPLADARRTQAASATSHPGLRVYGLPTGSDVSSGTPIPEGAQDLTDD
jgi:hypothetical protein